MFNRILVAIDGSIMSEKALKSAFNFVKERYSKISVIHVEKNIEITEGMPKATIDRIYSEQSKESEDLLHQATALAENEGIEIEVQLVMGEPAIQIVKKAEERNYQLIVMGSRGLGNIKGLMLGSVSQKVTQLSHCPVLIIK
ncbi:UspA domain-containing protein [Neobacillus bataviensis LMG 21833]|uniref:Universal stress protein n=1 Tax=Neobacillus bataviensis LMG 21833 TaxID=1117379 RepID=K6DEA8_9BACI|nr:universal stress protein [Neobacillus bataviensis]EKN70877.1 UspA domain-containing protein [Neobacillus bataviensis LMG 21833]